MSIHEDWQNPESPGPAKPGMSTTAKAMLIVGGAGMLCLLLCCGGGVLFYFRAKDAFKNMTSSDPQEIRKRTQEIAHIEIVPGFEPTQAMDIVFMRWVLYTKPPAGGSMLMLMELDQKMSPAGSGGDRNSELLKTMRQQNQSGQHNTDIDIEESRSRDFTIGGKTVPFQFNKGKTRDGKAVRQVIGSFDTPGGVALLMLTVAEEDYDEAAVDKMLQSIVPSPDENSPDAGAVDEKKE
jgi:hypothetical protein